MTQNFLEEREESADSLEKARNIVLEDFRYRRDKFNLTDIDIKTGYRVSWNGGRHQMTRNAFSSLLDLLGIPENFGEEIPQKLLQENVETLKSQKNEEILVLLRDDDTVVNFVKDPYNTASNLALLDLLKGISGLETETLLISDRGIQATLIGKELEGIKPKVGDITKVGYRVKSSETGGPRPKASFCTFRLVCSNGAVLPDKWGTARWPYDRRMRDASCLKKFREDLKEMSIGADLLSEHYRGLVNKKVTDEQFLKVWRAAKRTLDSREAADSLLEVEDEKRKKIYRTVRKRRERNNKKLVREPEPPEETDISGYDLFNRITEGAKRYGFVTRDSLELLGGRIVNLVNE